MEAIKKQTFERTVALKGRQFRSDSVILSAIAEIDSSSAAAKRR